MQSCTHCAIEGDYHAIEAYGHDSAVCKIGTPGIVAPFYVTDTICDDTMIGFLQSLPLGDGRRRLQPIFFAPQTHGPSKVFKTDKITAG